MHLKNLVTIDAEIGCVFSSLSEALSLWRGLPGFADKQAARLVLEPRFGGRFLASWESSSGANSEALIGTICAWSEPSLLRISGPFGVDAPFVHAMVSFELRAQDSTTQVLIQHESAGNVSEELSDSWNESWQNFLELLKSSMEADLFVQRSRGHTTSQGKSGLLANQAMKLLDAMESDLEEGDIQAWQLVVARVASFAQVATAVEQQSTHSSSSEEFVDEIHMQLEQSYRELETALIKIRCAVAEAIVTEKQLEQQLQKNKDQAETWLNRATMAVQQGSLELANQARHRMGSYLQAAEEIENRLVQQTAQTSNMRQQLTDIEATVQQAYTKKKVLIARDRSARATVVVNEILKNFDPSNALSAIAKAEESVLKIEAQASASATRGENADILISPESLTRAIKTLETTLEALAKLSQHIATDRAGRSSFNDESDGHGLTVN
jgi:phage shock protein A